MLFGPNVLDEKDTDDESNESNFCLEVRVVPPHSQSFPSHADVAGIINTSAPPIDPGGGHPGWVRRARSLRAL